MQRLRNGFLLGVLVVFLSLPYLLATPVGAAPAAATASEPKIDDPDRVLGSRFADVQNAARRLTAEDVDVVIIVANQVADASAGTYVTKRLGILGVNGSVETPTNGAPRVNLPGRTIVFYRAESGPPLPGQTGRSGQSGIYYVPGFKETLDPVLNQIFTERMRPLFTSGDVAGGMIAGLDAIRTTINPPTSPFLLIVLVAAVLGGAWLFIGPRLRKRQAAAATLAEAKERMTTAHKAAGAALANLAQLLTVAREKAQYDRISYSQTDAQHLTELQVRGEQLFNDAQAAYDQAEQDELSAQPPTVNAYNAVRAAYANAENLAERSSESIKEAERMRETLDRAAGPQGPATGATQRL